MVHVVLSGLVPFPRWLLAWIEIEGCGYGGFLAHLLCLEKRSTSSSLLTTSEFFFLATSYVAFLFVSSRKETFRGGWGRGQPFLPLHIILPLVFTEPPGVRQPVF